MSFCWFSNFVRIYSDVNVLQALELCLQVDMDFVCFAFSITNVLWIYAFCCNIHGYISHHTYNEILSYSNEFYPSILNLHQYLLISSFSSSRPPRPHNKRLKQRTTLMKNANSFRQHWKISFNNKFQQMYGMPNWDSTGPPHTVSVFSVGIHLLHFSW